MSGGTVGTPGFGRSLARLVVSIIIVLAVLLLVAGWYFADQVTARPTVRPFATDTSVVEADDATITLEATASHASSTSVTRAPATPGAGT